MLVAVGVASVALWALVLAQLRDVSVRWLRVCAIPLALGQLVGVVGLAKLVLGRTFGELAEAWDHMAGWQRGLVGTFVVALATVAFIAMAGVAIVVLS